MSELPNQESGERTTQPCKTQRTLIFHDGRNRTFSHRAHCQTLYLSWMLDNTRSTPGRSGSPSNAVEEPLGVGILRVKAVASMPSGFVLYDQTLFLDKCCAQFTRSMSL
jgi:hypothetical protein